MAIVEDTAIRTVGFTQAKSGLSELMTDVVHGHRPELIERHGGKEAAVLMSRADLVAVLSDYRFRPQIALGDGEATAVLEELGVVGAGGDFEAAMEDLLGQLRDYAHDFLVRRPGFYKQTARARHEPWLLRFALTPQDEQLSLLYDDSRAAAEEQFRTKDAALAP